MITIRVRDAAGNTVTREVNLNVETPSPRMEVWALQQIPLAAAQVREAVARTAVTGFSMRFPWKNYSPALLDQGKGFAGSKDYSIRFMAGRHTPLEIIEAGPSYTAPASGGLPSMPTPSPFYPDGRPNDAFEAAYEEFAEELAVQCERLDITLLHLSWYAQDWAELNHGKELRAVPGYSYARWLTAHKRLIDIGFRVQQRHPQLTVEWPLSGYGPISGNTPAAKDLASYAISLFGPDSDKLRLQSNGWGPNGVWGAPTATTENQLTQEVLPLKYKRGIQAIQPTTTWTDAEVTTMLNHLDKWNADYCELYVPTLTGTSGTRWNAALLDRQS